MSPGVCLWPRLQPPPPPSPPGLSLPFPPRVLLPRPSAVPTPSMRGSVWQRWLVLTMIISVIPSVVLCRPRTHVFSSIPNGGLSPGPAVEGCFRAHGLPSLAGAPV